MHSVIAEWTSRDGRFSMTYSVSSNNKLKITQENKGDKKVMLYDFAELLAKNNLIENFSEKLKGDGAWINGGFFVMNYDVFKFIKHNQEMFEHKPIEKLSHIGQVKAYKHYDFWQCMDTLREKNYLNNLWLRGEAKWK